MSIYVPSTETRYSRLRESAYPPERTQNVRNPATEITSRIFDELQEIKKRRIVENASARVIIYEGMDELGCPIVYINRFSDSGNDKSGHPNQADAQRNPITMSEGNVRAVRNRGLAFMIADGNGRDGHVIASPLSRKTIEFYNSYSGTPSSDREIFGDMRKALNSACDYIDDVRQNYERSSGHEMKAGAGFVFGVVKNGYLYTVNLADVRTFVKNPGSPRLVEATYEQSVVADLLRQGLITNEQAAKHPNKNIITRNLSVDTSHPDAQSIKDSTRDVVYNKTKLQVGSVIIGMTDGLENALGLPNIARMLETSSSPDRGAKRSLMETLAGWGAKTPTESALFAAFRAVGGFVLSSMFINDPTLASIVAATFATSPFAIKPKKWQ